jgi:iron complex transport system substrate-binding protein
VTFTGADGVESTITDTSRIVSLNGNISEVIFALGLGDQVVAVDVTTTYPPEAVALTQQGQVVGFAQQLTPEAVLRFEPTLVIGDQLVGPTDVLDQLRQTGVPVVILATQSKLEGVRDIITDVATVLGVESEGETLADQVMQEIDDTVALAAQADTTPRVAYVYVRGPQTLLLFGTGSPTEAMIEGANAIDAGADSGVQFAVPLTPEGLVAADPDYIIVPEGGLAALGGLDGFLKVPGVAETPAGKDGNILAYDEGIFINLGPRTGEALAALVADLHPELG